MAVAIDKDFRDGRAMNRITVVAAVVTGVMFGGGLCRADDDDDTIQVKLKPSGFVSMQMGQVVKGGPDAKGGAVDGAWIRQVYGNLSVSASLSTRTTLDVGMEMEMFNDFPIVTEATASQDFRSLNFYPYFDKAEITHVFGDVKDPYWTLTGGYFRFKYNPDARDLGEYLFRTGTYPQFINTDFDFPQARLLGFHAALHPLPNVTIDGLLYANLQYYAVGDWNLAAIVTYDPFKGVELGLGGSLCSILSADSSLTTPHDPSTAYHITYNATTGQADTSFFTFRGAKVMARASIDLKKFIGDMGLGKEDLKLYGEAAILGLENYPENLPGPGIVPINYDTLLDRIPVMAGLNLPTFKLLDVLSAQVEWFGSPYPNDIGDIVNNQLPIPLSITGNVYNYPDDHWKWSLYGTKKLYRNYSVTGQIANDHLRYLAAVTDFNIDFDEVTHSLNQWYYMLKFTARF